MAKQVLLDRILDAVSDRLRDPDVPVANHQVPQVARKVINAAAPIVTNATNSEPLYQSRVFLGSLTAVIGALVVIMDQFTNRMIDPITLGPAIATLIGAAFAIYGRVTSGLKPLFSRK